MQQQVNLTLNLPNNEYSRILSNPTFPNSAVNLVTSNSDTIFTNKTLIDETNDIAANKILISGQTLTIGPTGAINPGDILTYAGSGMANFMPTLPGGNVLSVSGKMGVVTLDKNDVGLNNVNNTSDATKPVSGPMQTALNTKVSTADLGVSVATLGLDGTLTSSQIPDGLLSGLIWKGTYNASSNIPAIPVAAVGNNGWFYKVSVPGTQILSGNSITFGIGDWLISNGVSWQSIPNSQNVLSVNSMTGNVILNQGSLGLGNVDNTSDLNKPISNATQSALDLKLNRSDVIDALNVGSSILPLSANQGMILNATKLGTSDIINDLVTGGPFKALSAAQGVVLQATKLNNTDIVDNLTTGGTTKALSAEQGKILGNAIVGQLKLSDIENNLVSTDPQQVLSAAQGPVITSLIAAKINTTSIVNDLVTGGTSNVLSAQQGVVLGAGKLNISDVVNDLVTGGATKALSAQQGVVLQTGKINTSAIIDNLTSVSATEVLSANQGRILNNSKINTSAIINDLTTGGASNVLSAAQGVVLNGMIGSKIPTSAIINDLTTGGASNVLSAAQGVVLKGLVDAALTSADIVNDLVTDDPTRVLSAAQGFALEGSKIPTSAIINDLTTGGASNVLSAAQGVVLQSTKIGLSDIINDLTTGGATKALSAAQGVVLQTTKFNSADVVNDLVTGGATKALSAAQGVILKGLVDSKINTSAVINDLTTGGASNVLSAQQGVVLNTGKLNISDVIDDLTTGGAARALSAQQGVVLQSTKINTSAIINDLVTGGANNVLSAAQGVILKGLVDSKINISSIADDLVTNNPLRVLSAAQGVVLKGLVDSKINTADIANDLVTNNPTKVLSAAQGVTLQSTKIDKAAGVFTTSFGVRNALAPSDVTFNQNAGGDITVNCPGSIFLQNTSGNSLSTNASQVITYRDLVPSVGTLNLGSALTGYTTVYAGTLNSTGNAVLMNSGGSVYMNTSGAFVPAIDGTQSLGTSGLKWSTVYATNGTINTSDVRKKKDIEDLPIELLRIWPDYVKVKSYRWLEGSDKKQIGVMAQDIILAFNIAGLDWRDYGIIEEDPETGHFGVNYNMILCVEIASLRAKLC